MSVVIAAQGAYLPETKLTSEAIEARLAPVYERLRLPQGRLELMSGIQERGLWPVGTAPSSLAAHAAKNLFANSAYGPKDIDLVIHASVCRDFLEPATASVVHAELGLRDDAGFFDLSNACLGVLSALEVARTYLLAGEARRILIVSGENAGPLIEQTLTHLLNDTTLTRKTIKKYLANLTIGSGAVAWLITRKEDAPHAPEVEGLVTLTDSSANTLCRGGGDTQGLTMETDSEALLAAGVQLAQKTWRRLLEAHHWKTESFDWIIGHQVGSAHELAILKALDLSERPTHKTYPHLGNTGSAALPLTLWELTQSGRLGDGERIGLLGIGSGLSSTMLALKWRTSHDA